MKRERRPVPIDRVREMLDYDPLTGLFTWKVSRGGVLAGSVAGSINHGYVIISVGRLRLRAHRIAWAWMTGEQPPEQIDHEDTNKINNRWFNLRPATGHQNQANRGANANNKSGFKGVYWNRDVRRWAAQIGVNGRMKYLGLFDDPEDAARAYAAAAAVHHAEFAHRITSPAPDKDLCPQHAKAWKAWKAARG